MKLNQKLIQQLRNGEINAENDGTLEQLRDVLKAAFPEDIRPIAGDCKYYSRLANTDGWTGYSFKDKDLPTFKISDFYQPERLPKYSNGGLVPPLPPKPKTNPIHYTVGGTTYSLNYQELKAEYDNVVAYTHPEFMDNLPQIAHLACVVSTLKGLGTQATIGDKGIIHELIHLMTDPNEPTNDLAEIRDKFNKLIRLV